MKPKRVFHVWNAEKRIHFSPKQLEELKRLVTKPRDTDISIDIETVIVDDLTQLFNQDTEDGACPA